MLFITERCWGMTISFSFTRTMVVLCMMIIQLESRDNVDEDGTVDLTGASMYVLERGKDFVQNYDMDVLRYFVDIAREHTASFNHQGRYWQEMRRERANWFETEQKGTAMV